MEENKYFKDSDFKYIAKNIPQKEMSEFYLELLILSTTKSLRVHKRICC